MSDDLIECFEKRALWDGPAWLEAARPVITEGSGASPS